MYLFSTIFCMFFFTSFLFFEGTFSSPYIKGKTKQNSCIINIYNCTREMRVGGFGINSGFPGFFKDTIHCVHIIQCIRITVEPKSLKDSIPRGLV